ncbi:MAG: trehalose-6-phosphate synthase [Thermoanaerobaculaceae bacterium]|nr:trehalose-6-phosphate synthase [Thermoanaerobaculaceae bacterium]
MAGRPQLARSLRLGFLIAAIIGATVGSLAWRQVNQERRIDLDDVNRRAQVLARQLAPTATKALELPDAQAREELRPRLRGYRALLGYAVFRPDGVLVAAGNTVAEFSDRLGTAVSRAVRTGAETITRARFQGTPIDVYAVPLEAGPGVIRGVLVVAHDVTFIDERATGRLVQFGFWILILTLLTVTLVVGATWLTYERPLHILADWMRRLRTENVGEGPPAGVPSALLRSETDRLAASFRAARSTGQRLSQAAMHAEQVWTRDRLRTHAVAALGEDRQLVVVSNREPYMHQLQDGKLRTIVPAGGLVTALDPVLRACGGVWIAHGAGDSDRETADESGRLTVPPGDPRYTLRRVWLTREEEQGYYYGFSNEGLWPLCHLAHERPVFRAPDWRFYRRANELFAETVLEEIGGGNAVVLVQDYQLALVPALLKAARPELQVGLFWHIPWPNPEAFRICPYGAEILTGMLGADLIGFHLQQHCNSFLDTVDRVLESRLDWDHFAVELKGHVSHVQPFPISVQPWTERKVPTGEALAAQIAGLKAEHSLEGVYIAVGVDRIDYTKGLPERFRAVDRFLERWPQYRQRFTFVELGAPSRTHIPRYRDHIAELEKLVDEINWKHQTDGWKPIRFLVAHHDVVAVHAFMRMASMCIVSSLHDGMNLVAKEYVAAQPDREGVLILSEFAGASRELGDALIINPYDTEQFAEAIRAGVEMDPAERHARMDRMARAVEEHNIYRWAAAFLTRLGATRTPAAAGGPLTAAAVDGTMEMR